MSKSEPMPNMNVFIANPRGFCAGVDRAIQIVEVALEKYGAPVYVRHEIVHNKFVVEGLKKRGAIFVDELDEVPEDVPVVFSAHGVPKTTGTFEDAVDSAVERAGIVNYKIVFWEDPVPWNVKLISEFLDRNISLGNMLTAQTMSPQEILAARVMERLSLFSQLNDPNHSYVLCVSCMNAFGDR